MTATFGVGTRGWSRLVRLLVGRLSPAGLAATGGGLLVAGWDTPRCRAGPPRSSRRNGRRPWPCPRRCCSSLVGAGTAAAGPLADPGAYGTAFGLAFAVSVPLAVAAAVARRCYTRW